MMGKRVQTYLMDTRFVTSFFIESSSSQDFPDDLAALSRCKKCFTVLDYKTGDNSKENEFNLKKDSFYKKYWALLFYLQSTILPFVLKMKQERMRVQLEFSRGYNQIISVGEDSSRMSSSRWFLLLACPRKRGG